MLSYNLAAIAPVEYEYKTYLRKIEILSTWIYFNLGKDK